MGILDEIEEQIRRGGSRPCVWDEVRESLDEEEWGDLEVALENERGFSGAAIARALKARGINVTHQTVNRHRRRLCMNCYG